MDDALVQALRTLAADPGAPLLGYADPDRELVPPVWIWLRSGCAEVAAALDERFGDRLDLRVGFLPFPPGRDTADCPRPADLPAAPPWLTVRPVEPVMISRDRDSTRTSVRVSNGSAQDALVTTAGAARGQVLDPTTQSIVGGAPGVMNLLARTFELPAGGSVDVPAVFGPASMRADLGYQLLAGEWLGCVDLSIHAGRSDGTRTEVRSSPFPVRIG